MLESYIRRQGSPMAKLDKLETTLDDVLNKNAPFKVPESGRKSLAHNMWWLALVFGVLELWAAWALWHAAHLVDQLVDYTNSLYSAYGVAPVDHNLGPVYYLAFGMLLVTAVLALLAAPHLKAMKKAGWNLMFYSILINVVYAVVVLFADYGGFGNMLAALVGSVVGAYLLFQVRDQFMKNHKS